MASSLPSSDSSELYLDVATPEEVDAQQRANSGEWRGALSLSAYLRREEMLADQDLTKDGGITVWVLVYQPAGSSEEDRKVLCGCESIKKRGLMASSNSVEVVTAHGIASVFCPKEFRGKGYAGRMMVDLGAKLRTWQSKGQQNRFSVLWSDIGKDFYAARGWKVFPSSHISLKAQSSHTPDLPTQPLTADDLPYLCEADEHSLFAQMTHSQKPTVALVPDLATLSWHHAREEFIGNELFNRKPEIKGAIVGTESGKQAWCIWTRVWAAPDDEEGESTLHILRLVVEEGLDAGPHDFEAATEDGVANVQSSAAVDAVAALFAAAQKQAAEWGMRAVEFWNPNAVALAAVRKIDGGVKVLAREKASISSLMWYGEDSQKDVEWVCNEKFGWC